MNILVVGSGGREHALCWKLGASDLLDKIYCAPGNAGIAQNAECVDIAVDDLKVFLEVGNAEAIVTAVSSNLGVSFVSKLAASYALSWGAVVEVPVNGIKLKRELCMARCSIVKPNQAQEAFWSFIHHPENDDLFALAEA